MSRNLSTLILAALFLFTAPCYGQAAPAEDSNEWNLTHLFADEAAWDRERQRLLAEFDRIAAFQGTLGNSVGSPGTELEFAL